MKKVQLGVAAIALVAMFAPALQATEVCTYKVTSSSGFLCPFHQSSTACVPVTTSTGTCDTELRCIGHGLLYSCDITASPVRGPDRVCAFGTRLLTNLRCAPSKPRPRFPSATPTEPPSEEPTATPTATVEAETTPTEVETTPTALETTPTEVETPEESPTGTAVVTPTPSQTAAVATATAETTATPTGAATATQTTAATETATVVSPPTETSTVPPAATATATALATDTATPPATATAVATDTPTVGVPTSTPTIAEQSCALAAAGSNVQIHIAALPVPLSFGISGSIKVGAAGDAASCSVDQINAINIPSIGFVCISPASGCALGQRDCDGGTPLGIDVSSDGNIGTCTSNTACADSCAFQCGGAAKVLQSGCTGFCSAGDQSACTTDAQCATAPKGGQCNGPDPVGGNAGICQCTCVDTAAHGASDAGDLQCNLGASLVVETGAPCGGGDVLINVGSTCIPVTTQEASSLITDANFTPGSTVPVSPNVNDLMGTAVSCSTFDTAGPSGLKGVGAVNFFGSALGDLAVGLSAQCQ